MTDLKNGIIEIDGFEITNKTTKQELLEHYGNAVSSASSAYIVDLMQLSVVDNTHFGATFFFHENNKISGIKLVPYIQYASEEWDRTGQQEERRCFCDKWLFAKLGESHKIINGDIEYTFSSSRISCFSNYDIHDGANAGYIIVEFFN